MKKMMGIIMMGTGLILLVSGYFVYVNKEKILAKEEVEGQIQAVVADGVFTDREKTHIGQLADKHNIDKEELFAQINEKLSSNEEEVETEVIDQKKRKGDDFEKFIVKKFNRKLFTIKQWAGDKYVDGIYDETTQQPDLVVEFHYKDIVQIVAIECKWRKDYYKGGIEFSYDEQLKRYKQYEREEKTDVYIALGVGGKASEPKELYLLPLKNLDKPDITRDQLKGYKRNVDDGFYFNMKKRTLDIKPYPDKKSMKVAPTGIEPVSKV